MKQFRQVGNHPRTIFAVGLGAGGPDQIGGRPLESDGFLMLRAVFHRGDRQHLGPHFEEKFADAFPDGHVIEHVSHLNGVLDRHRFLLLNLLCQRHDAGGTGLLGKELRQEFLKFVVDDLKYPSASFGILLNDLDDAPDF